MAHPKFRVARFTAVSVALAVTFFAAYAAPSAQQAPAAQQAAPAGAKKALTVDDYPKWKSIAGQDISGDGKWVAYVLQSTNVPTTETKPILHIQNLESGQEVTIADATGNAFSSDSKWIAYSVEPAAGRGGRAGRAGGAATGAGQSPAADAPATPAVTPGQDAPGGRAGAPAAPAQPRRTELRNLATGEIKQWQDIQSFSFSSNATHLLLRRRAPQAVGAGRTGGDAAPAGGGAAAGGGATAATPAGPRGVDVTVHNLTTGKDQLLGSVGDSAFNKSGDLLAYTVDAATKDSNGLFLMELKANRIFPLDNDAKNYNRLTWNDDGTALAVLKGADIEKMREKNNVMLVYRDVKAAMADGATVAPIVLDPTKVTGTPKDWVVSERATIDWSDDGKRLFFGMKPQVPAPVTGARRNADEVADVDIWNTSDERIQSQQMIRADQDRNFTFREAFDADAKKFVLLADDTMRELDVAADGTWAIGRDTRGYISDYKPPMADIYRVNTSTGERTLITKGHLLGAGTL
ncbi:MAG: hypothetical protein KA205_02135, partial [Acidobacteria bacterium]|nr:hypothetical protein [Acidobacteriota bacterium]